MAAVGSVVGSVVGRPVTRSCQVWILFGPWGWMGLTLGPWTIGLALGQRSADDMPFAKCMDGCGFFLIPGMAFNMVGPRLGRTGVRLQLREAITDSFPNTFGLYKVKSKDPRSVHPIFHVNAS